MGGGFPQVAGASTGFDPMAGGFGGFPMGGPSQVAPTQVAPAQVSPTQHQVNTNVFNTVVPHVHPSHTTTVNKQIFTHKHFFPHTQSVVNECYNQHMICKMPHHNPCCGPHGF